jgi:hypothetical protein
MYYAEFDVFDIINFDFKHKIFFSAYVISTYRMFYFFFTKGTENICHNKDYIFFFQNRS